MIQCKNCELMTSDRFDRCEWCEEDHSPTTPEQDFETFTAMVSSMLIDFLDEAVPGAPAEVRAAALRRVSDGYAVGA